MTVLTLSQAKVLAPRAFGSGKPSPRCDLCEEKWTDNRRPMATQVRSIHRVVLLPLLGTCGEEQDN